MSRKSTLQRIAISALATVALAGSAASPALADDRAIEGGSTSTVSDSAAPDSSATATEVRHARRRLEIRYKGA